MKKYTLYTLLIFSFVDANYIEYISVSNIIVFLSVLFGFVTAAYTILLFLPITKKMYLKRHDDSNQLNKFFFTFRVFFTVQIISIIYFLIIENYKDLLFYMYVYFGFELKYIVLCSNFILIFVLLSNVINFYRLVNFLENVCVAIIKKYIFENITGISWDNMGHVQWRNQEKKRGRRKRHDMLRKIPRRGNYADT